jgi:hypothetical protein
VAKRLASSHKHYKPSRNPTDRSEMTLEEWAETFGPKNRGLTAVQPDKVAFHRS